MRREKIMRPKIGALHSPQQNKMIALDQFQPKTSKNSKSKSQLTPKRRERLLKVLTKEKAKDSLVLKYLQERISKVKQGEKSGLDVTELQVLENEIKKRMPQPKTNQQTEQKEEQQQVSQQKAEQQQQQSIEHPQNVDNKGGYLKGKWRNEKQAKTLNPDDEASPKSIYEIADDQDEYDLIVKYNTEQYKRNLQQKFIEKKQQQQMLGESYSQQIEHKKLQKKLEDLQSKRIKEQFDDDVKKYKQEQIQAKLKEKQKIRLQSEMIKESLENYQQKKKLQNSLIYNEGAEYQGQAQRALQQEREERRIKKQYEFKFFKQLEDLTEEEKLKAQQNQKQEKEEERKLLQDRVLQFNKMDKERYKDKEKVQQKATMIENIITPVAESHFSTKTQRIANQELLHMKQAYILDEQEKQKEYERQHRQKELQKQINSILDLQIREKQAQKQQEKCDDIEQSNIFRLNDREYLTQQNQIQKQIKSQNQLHAEQLQKQIEVNKEKKQVEKYMSVNEIIYNKDLLKNASRDVSDYSIPLSKRELMLPRIQKNIYHSNFY